MADQTQQAFNFEDTAPPADENQSIFGYTAEGLQQEADKYAAEFTEDDSSSLETAASYLVPYYDSGVNIANVVEEYLKPEEERDYDYIKSQFKEAGQSAALETGLLLMGGVATKYGAKGIKALANKARQYELDPNSMSAFGVGSVRRKADEISLPPAENAARTQIAGTLPTYKKADALLTEVAGEGKTLDFGAGLGLSKKELGFDTYEPFPKGDFTPDFTSPDKIPSSSYKKITNLNVLNVVPRDVRDGIVKDIGRILEPNGTAVITTRGRDVMAAKGKPGPEPMSIITSKDTYQKGFTQAELREYISDTLGDGFKIVNNKLGAAGVTVQKLAQNNFKEGGMAMDDQMKLTFKSRRTGYALGGEVEAIDPVSGNEVPPGSTPEEVRDDIPAMLSEGEYVVPADVTRYYGVKFFEDLREQAKVDLEGMAANGRIGGEPMPEGEDDLTEDEMALLQEVMAEGQPVGMNQGGMVNQQVPYLSPQQPMSNPQLGVDPSQPTSYTKPLGMAAGGSVAKDPFGNPIQPVTQSPNQPAYSVLPLNPTNPQGIYGVSTAAGTPYTATTPPTTRAVTSTPSTPTTGTSTPTADTSTSTGGMATKFYINKDCVRISVLTLNGKPISSVPANFNEYLEDTPENSALFGCTITDIEDTTDTTDTDTDTVTTGASVDVDDDNAIDNYNVNVKTTVDPDTPDGVRKMYEDSGVNANDPLAGAKTALSDAFKIPKAAGSFLTAINPFLGVAGAGINAISQLSALSKANANLKMADFLGMTEASKAIQKEIDSFLEKAPGIVSSLDSVFAKGDERFNNALESSLSQYAVEGSVLNVEGLNEVGKKNLKEYLGYDYTEVPLTGGGAVATDPSSQGSTASSYTAPKSGDGFNQGFFTPGPTTVRPKPRPGSVSDPVSATQTTASTPSSVAAAESASSAATKSWSDATQRVNSLGSDADPAEWHAAVQAQSAASKAATQAAKAATEARNNDDDPSNDGNSSACFLTTAIVERRGEEDNGPTLTKLRNFRDTFMASNIADVEEYYRIAPKIVASIPEDHDDWDWIGSQVDKSVEFIDKNLLDKAYTTYKNMVKKLEKDWL